jgi:hypothetical protein
MLPLLFELLNHLHKRPVQNWIFVGGQIAYKNNRKSVKKVSFEKKHGLMLLFKKNHQKTARDLN